MKRILLLCLLLCPVFPAMGQTDRRVPVITYYRFNDTKVRGDEILEYVGTDDRIYKVQNDANQTEGNYTVCILGDVYGVAPSSDAFGEDSTIFYVQGPSSFYIDMATREEKYVWEFSGEYFDIRSASAPYAWTITDERKEVAGIPCRKAIGTSGSGSKATVWYSEEIPIPFGPNEISGTPGLVVTLQLGAFNYILEDVTYSDKVSEIRYVPKGRQVTEEEYDAYVAEQLERYSEPVQEGNTTRQFVPVEEVE